MKEYNWQNIQTLLIKGFSPNELRDLCFLDPNFKPVLDELPDNPSKAELIRRLLEYADHRLLVDALLELLEGYNPARYKEHQPYYQIIDESSTTGSNKLPQAQSMVFKGKEYIYIPPGPFVMGSAQARVDELNEADNSDVYSAEAPRHSVTLNGYYLARYPVTNLEYQVFINETGQRVPYRDDPISRPFNWDLKTRTFPAGRDNHPVVLVSWHQAQAYCRWLGGRLPTEAEWEKAARGEDGLEWPWGNFWQEDCCNSAESNLRETTPVGYFSPLGDSPYGVGDMVGNVWEWCSSLLRPYPYQADHLHEDPASLAQRILRGGAFGINRFKVRCAFRHGLGPDDYGFTIGFRVVLSPGSAGRS